MDETDLANAITDAEKRLEDLDRQIKLTEWESTYLVKQYEAQARAIRDQALGVQGELIALRRLQSTAPEKTPLAAGPKTATPLS